MKNPNKVTLPPLDTTLSSYEERISFINNIFTTIDTSKLTQKQLEKCSDYIIEAMSREERRQHHIITRNRQSTISKRETSYDALVEKLEGGEDSLYNYIINDKNRRLTHDLVISDEDAAKADMQQLHTAIQQTLEMQKAANTAHDRHILHKQLIELRQSQYFINDSYHPCGHSTLIPTFQEKRFHLNYAESRWVDDKGQPHSDAIINFFLPEHIAALLRYHEELAIAAEPNSELYFLLQDFDALVAASLADEPQLLDIVQLKYKKCGGADIQKHLTNVHALTLTLESISRTWCIRIPKKIAEFAKQEYIRELYFKKNKIKQCSRCSKYKPAHQYFYSPNPQTKDGFASCCKECRKARKD